MKIVYGFFEELEKGVQPGDLWFTRSAFAAGALLEAEGLYGEAANVYTRVVEAGVPAAEDARERIKKLKSVEN